MLVLSRQLNEKILFPTLQTSIQVVGIKPGVVRIGINAPDSLPIFREEIYDPAQYESGSERSREQQFDEILHQVRNRLQSNTVGLALLKRQLERGLTQDAQATLSRLEEQSNQWGEQIEKVSDHTPNKHVRRRALVVEDDQNECELLAGFLRMAGLEVDTAGDGAMALDALHTRGKPDIVLLDMVLPRCDGPTTVRAIRKDPTLHDVKIFALTGLNRDRFDVENGPQGIDRWFRKPLNPETLLRELRENLSPGASSPMTEG